MCGVEVILCLACGAGVGGIAAWKARGAMTHKGKVVVDQQGRVMGKDGKLLKDKKGNFVYIKDGKDKKKPKGPVADSGETHKKSGKQQQQQKKKINSVPTSRLPFSKKNAVSVPSGDKDRAGQWGAAEMDAWHAHVAGKENTQAAH